MLIPVKLICQGYLGGFRDSHSKSSSVDKAAINMLLTRLFLSGIRDDDGISFIINPPFIVALVSIYISQIELYNIYILLQNFLIKRIEIHKQLNGIVIELFLIQ